MRGADGSSGKSGGEFEEGVSEGENDPSTAGFCPARWNLEVGEKPPTVRGQHGGEPGDELLELIWPEAIEEKVGDQNIHRLGGFEVEDVRLVEVDAGGGHA